MNKFFALFLCVVVAVQCLDDDSCHSYGGGSVYPSFHYGRGDHDLLSTQAVSEYSKDFCFHRQFN